MYKQQMTRSADHSDIPGKIHFHGSDLEKIEEVYGIRKEDIISFSSNVNPLGISPRLRQVLADKIDVISTYPDREYTALRECMAAYCHASADDIIVGNGSSELISLFIKVLHPKKSLIIGPTYSEYEREVSLGDGTSLYYPLKEEDLFELDVTDLCNSLNESIDLLILCNPNNPTSSSISAFSMRRILDVCKQYDITVLTDETYVEFAEDMEQTTAIPLTKYYNNIIILRGISKFFAAPGLRLGYAVTGNRELLKKVNTLKNPWTINSLAALAGELMFTDEEYIARTRALISSERKRLYDILSNMEGIKVYPPKANFILVKLEKPGITSWDLFDQAIRQKMMIRDCSTFPFLHDEYIRFCFLTPEQNDQLIDCIRECLA